MKTTQKRRWLLLSLFAFGRLTPAQTFPETIIHSFGYFPQGDDPCGTLARDAAGNLYGTTYYGGSSNLGVVFQWQPSSGYRQLYSFAGGSDGANPHAGVTLDARGNLYGTTYAGGANNVGVVYKISAAGEESVLHTFGGGADGAHPYAGVVLDASGNLYGTTYYGGTANAGVVYRLDTSGQETILYTFSGGEDGANPYAGVVLDRQGNLYGTTTGGDPVFGGLIFKVSPKGQETVIYGHLGTDFQAGVILDAAGNLYGANEGYVFKVSPAGQYTELGAFDENVVGGNITSALVMDAAGNLFGTTAATTLFQEQSPNGAIFEVSAGTKKVEVLYRFPGYPANEATGGQVTDVNNPGLILDGAGNLYGITQDIGLGGAIYERNAAGTVSVLYRFPTAQRGSFPVGPLDLDPGGTIYGITGGGGPVNQGVLFELTAAGEEVLPPNPGTAGMSVARDNQGNLYIAGGSSVEVPGNIYKITPSGTSTTIYSFSGGADGNGSEGVIVDGSGNVYGVSTGGGAPYGLVFKLSASGQFTVLYSFLDGADGAAPNNELTLDGAGNLYGTTEAGGGAGLIYRVGPTGGETVLHTFDGSDGDIPQGRLALDKMGNLYGTTEGGGAAGQGVLYKLSREGRFSILHTFAFDSTGGGPLAGPTVDSAGNLYGTTNQAGDLSCSAFGAGDPFGCGVVYELSHSGVYTVLHTFESGPGDGAAPQGEVTLDAQGNLYGTTPLGGFTGTGVIYKVSRN